MDLQDNGKNKDIVRKLLAIREQTERWNLLKKMNECSQNYFGRDFWTGPDIASTTFRFQEKLDLRLWFDPSSLLMDRGKNLIRLENVGINKYLKDSRTLFCFSSCHYRLNTFKIVNVEGTNGIASSLCGLNPRVRQSQKVLPEQQNSTFGCKRINRHKLTFFMREKIYSSGSNLYQNFKM